MSQPALAARAPRGNAVFTVVVGLAGVVGLLAVGSASGISSLALVIAALVGVPAVAAVAWWQYCSGLRRDLHRLLTVTTAGFLGHRGEVPASVRLRRWTGGVPGAPREVVLRGRVGCDQEPGWSRAVVDHVERHLDACYRIAAHDPVRARLVLRLVDPEDRLRQPMTDRAERVVTDLIGPTTKVHKIDVDEEGIVQRIAVEHRAGAKLVPTGYRARIEATVSAMLPGRWRAHWDMEGDRAVFEVRPQLPTSIWIDPISPPETDPLRDYESVEIPYAIDEDGNPLIWRPAVNPQFLIIGGTGSGKTSTEHGLLGSVAQYGWPVWVVDGKAIEFLGFQDWPNVQVVASTIEDQVAVIHRAWQLMEHRYQMVVSGEARNDDFEPLLLFVDEYTDLKANLLSWYAGIKGKGDPTKPVTLAEVASIARKGRTARIHMILAMQRPDAEILSGEVRDNFTNRLSIGKLSQEGAQMMWNNPAVGVAIPSSRRGRGVAMNAQGLPVEVQCFRTPDPAKVGAGSEEAELLERLKPAAGQQERLLVLPPESVTDLDSGEVMELRISDYLEAEWVPAAARPDLDPVKRRGGKATRDGRAASSPMALLGLAGGRAAQSAPGEASRSVAPEVEETAAEPEEVPVVPTYEESSVKAAGLAVGDLVCVDEERDLWSMVDEVPVEDLDDPGCVVVPWRSDDDEIGDLVLPADSVLPVRRYLDAS